MKTKSFARMSGQVVGPGGSDRGALSEKSNELGIGSMSKRYCGPAFRQRRMGSTVIWCSYPEHRSPRKPPLSSRRRSGGVLEIWGEGGRPSRVDVFPDRCNGSGRVRPQFFHAAVNR